MPDLRPSRSFELFVCRPEADIDLLEMGDDPNREANPFFVLAPIAIYRKFYADLGNPAKHDQ
ncbi:MAG TPA: hypothetical protein VK614_15420 [Allosphingosinicella sp.]|nr:hypothetical protein [Allosphingosinicella sp.]